MKTLKFSFLVIVFTITSILNAQIKVDQDGNVGIGESNPSSKLVVNDDGYTVLKMGGLSTATPGNSALMFYPNDGLKVGNASYWLLSFRNDTYYGNQGSLVFMSSNGTSNTSPIILEDNGNVILCDVAPRKGNVGIGRTPSASYKLDVNGSIQVNSTVYSSDARLKENITDIDSDISAVMKLRPVSYNMKKSIDKSEGIKPDQNKLSKSVLGNDTTDVTAMTSSNEMVNKVEKEDPFYNRKHMGFLAQDMKEIFPELVYEDDNGVLGIDYVSLIPVLVSALKEQQSEIEALKKQVDQLQK